LFDGNCGFCTAVAHWGMDRWPTAADVMPWQQADLEALGLDASDCGRELQFVGTDGGHAGGAQAIGRWLQAVGGLWTALGWLAVTRPTSWLADGVYRVVADNRRRLPGVQPACQRHRGA
jgi:predicted DCC family thiol-disulfide oxidoreductase YuxK